jgi:hypothetical protein
MRERADRDNVCVYLVDYSCVIFRCSNLPMCVVVVVVTIVRRAI